MTDILPKFELNPPQYHKDVVEYIQSHSPQLWEMYQTGGTKSSLSEETTSLLLKNSVRLDSQTHEKLYSLAETAKEKLDISAPFSFYQTTDIGLKNAMLYFVPDEIHIVLQGDILESLSDSELTALIAHEMSHFKLWSIDGSSYYITDRILDTNADHANASVGQILTARNYQLYTEIFADLGSLYVTEDLDAVISTLIKIETGLKKTNVKAFLEQAEELSQKGDIFTEGNTHPEAIIRARALSLKSSSAEDYDQQLKKMIEGVVSLERLDVLSQLALQKVTQEIITWYLAPMWMQDDTLITHSGFYNISKKSITSELSEDLIERTTEFGEQFHNYFTYILLDFVAINHDLEDVPLVRALYIAEELGFRAVFEKAVCKELKYRKNFLKILWSQKSEIFKKAEENFSKDKEA